MQSVEGPIHSLLSALPDPHQWKLIHNHESSIIINTYSQQQFQFFPIYPSKNISTITSLKRSLFCLPNTPKTILIPNFQPFNHQEPTHILFIQKAPCDLEKLLKYHRSQNSILSFCVQLLTAASILTKKFGYFDINQKMIRASKDYSLTIWIHSNLFSSQPQHPLTRLNSSLGEDLMVRRLLKTIKKMSGNCFLKSITKMKKYLCFEEIIKRIQKKIELQKKLGELKNFILLKKLKDEESPLKIKSIECEQKLNLSHPNFQNSTHFDESFQMKNPFLKTKSPRTQFSPQAKRVFSHNINQPRNLFRDSQKTISTASQWYSINASGKQKVAQINSSFDAQKRKLLSTFGYSHKEVLIQEENNSKFQVKESKIIEQKAEQTFIQSPLMRSPRCISIHTKQSIGHPGDELENQISHLFKSGTNQRHSYELEIQVESELNRLLFD